MDQNAAIGLCVALLGGMVPQAVGQTVPDSGGARRDDPLWRTGFGFTLTAEQTRHRASMRSVFLGIPKLVVVGPTHSSYALVLTTPDGGVCTPSLYIDGLLSGVEELTAFRPAHVARIDVYARPSTAPFLLPDRLNCGVIAVWTTTAN